MKYRRVGNSGLKVSEISLGSWLTYGTAVEKEAAEACVRTAFECGINFFDTANVYNRGEGEVAMGQALKPYPRSSYVLASKVYFPMGDGPNDRGLSRKHIIEQCEASLKRLGTDYLDIYFCHRYDDETSLEETLRALDDLVAQGKVLYAGTSEWTAAQIVDAVHIADKRNLRPIVVNQPIYNMFERYIENEILPMCEARGIGQVVFSPLAQGVLTGKYKLGRDIPADSRAASETGSKGIKRYMQRSVLEAVSELEKLAQEAGMKLSQLALAWVLRHPGVSSAIIGATKPEQIRENVKAVEITLTPDLLDAIEGILAKVTDYTPRRYF